MEILIISGLSGGGKSKAASFLEDIGYYIVDNLPAEMMVKFADFCAASSGRYDRVALVYDVRAGEPFDLLVDTLERLKTTGVNCRMLFLEASTNTIINRYKETRRIHPLASQGLNIEQAIAKERELMQPVRDHADFVLDSSSFSTAKLRSEMLNLFGDQKDRMGLNVNVLSFGFKHGIPIEADLVFDVRFMPNPYYVAELKNKTGLDAEVRDFVLSFQQTHGFLEQLKEMLKFLLPLYKEEGKTVLVIAIGCTGGHHRSVAVAHEISEFIVAEGYPVTENHRDISR
ncbi:MAG: RNase adapter RapZ [Ruminococcaceae bacterium]|nr:RNase adapter RapZ [Oscillospiraceae bacterium]